MADRFVRSDGYRIEAATYHGETLDGMWWVFDPDGRRVKSYTADTLEQADERFAADLKWGRVR